MAMLSSAGRERVVEWQTMGLIVVCYGIHLVAGLAWQTSWGWVVLPILIATGAFHTSLQHEVIHGHPTSNGLLNELLVSVPLAIVFPFRRYRDLHLKHHQDLNLTDPYEDPESYFWPLARYRTMRPLMRALFAFNNTFVGRLLIGPALSIAGFARTEWAALRSNQPGVRFAWFLHVCGLVVMYLLVTMLYGMPFWLYLLAVVYPALSLISMRSYAEHQAAEQVGARSAIVETVPPLALLYLNNNLHIVHHAAPNVAWYDLPELYQERRDIYLAANEHYLFNGYGEIARRFAFTARQSVDHPFLHRDEWAEG